VRQKFRGTAHGEVARGGGSRRAKNLSEFIIVVGTHAKTKAILEVSVTVDK
jgi:hypothetical protein